MTDMTTPQSSSSGTETLVLLPRKLTAENGAKAALIGEFYEDFGTQDSQGNERWSKVAVTWDTIKRIWDAAVTHFESQPAHAAQAQPQRDELVDPEEQSYERANTVPVAWIAFSSNGNIQLWTSDAGRAKEERERGLDLRAFTLSELVALVSKLPAQGAGDRGEVWQPIETAPRDGTPIEVCNTRLPSHAPVIVRWTEAGLSEDLLDEPHWCDAATADGSALYYNQNYFDFWKRTTALPSTQLGAAAEWPAGCHSPNSCRRNGRCMYIGCKHDGSEAMKEPANG